MESAYDHIQEETLKSEQEEVHKGKQPEEGNLNTDFQEAYKAFSASPWGTKLGGFLGTVKKQGESYYQGARQEAVLAGEEALKGFTDLRSTIVNRARSLSLGEQQAAESSEDRLTISPSKENTSTAAKEVVPDEKEADSSQGSKDIDDKTIQESEGIISRFKAEAEKRLKDIQKAEDAADEALLQFGTNISNFFRDAVTIAPPGDEKDKDGKTKVLFESKDSEGKRVIHTTRFDAQLHVIHCNLDSFTKDPASPEYAAWRDGDFSVERKTDDIASDLEKYDELRRAMEKLVPEKVEYEQFWRRYYFLRMVIETEEKRRKEILKGRNLLINESSRSLLISRVFRSSIC